jgi:putative transcriptional regulator
MNCKLKNRVSECLAVKGTKKSQLAYYMGKSRSYVTRLERGEIRPSAEAMLLIARYFKRPVEQVFELVQEGTDEKGRPEILKAPGSRIFPCVPATDGNS